MASRFIVTAIAALAGLFGLAGQAKAQCQYDVTVLQFPINCEFGLPVITSGFGLNELGAVVGYYYCPTWEHDEAFLWTPEGGYVTLGRPPGVSSAIPTDINDQGVICGTMIVADVGFRGFVYDHGEWTELPPVVDAVGAWSSAAAISNDNIVVGRRSVRVDTAPQNAYIWSAEQGFTDLTVLGDNSAATAINGTRVVGWRADAGQEKEGFLWQDGKATLLGPVPGGFTSDPYAVSQDGIVVGSGRIPLKGSPVGAPRAFVWDSSEFIMLGTLPAHAWSRALDIRSAPQQVVGRSWNVDGNPNISHGFIWENAVMTNLNELIRPDLELLIQSAGAIASRGQIVANGHDPNGDVVAFLLTPIKPPFGDLDGDCEVGILDLLILLAAWGETGSRADLNNDGVVGILDLLILLANWT